MVYLGSSNKNRLDDQKNGLTSELGKMYYLLLESHSLRNYHQLHYKLSTHSSAKEGRKLVNLCCWILILESESTDMLLIWCWI